MELVFKFKYMDRSINNHRHNNINWQNLLDENLKKDIIYEVVFCNKRSFLRWFSFILSIRMFWKIPRDCATHIAQIYHDNSRWYLSEMTKGRHHNIKEIAMSIAEIYRNK
jgi:hypothetical protein